MQVVSADALTRRVVRSGPQEVEGTLTSDRVCTKLAVCEAGSYVETPPTKASEAGLGYAYTSPRVCGNCTGADGAEASDGFSDGTNAEKCTELTKCSSGVSYETTAPSASADRACGGCRNCTGIQFQASACTLISDRVCKVLTDCSPGQYVTEPPGSGGGGFVYATDRECGNCSGADAGSSAVDGDGFSTGVNVDKCTPLTVCNGTGQMVDTPPTAQSDRTCKCAATHYKSSGPGNLTCSECTVCGSGQEAKVACIDGGVKSDGAGQAGTCQCRETYYQVSGDPLKCANITTCTPSEEYETKAPVPRVSDRQCIACTKCSGDNVVEAGACGGRVDRTCKCDTDHFDKDFDATSSTGLLNCTEECTVCSAGDVVGAECGAGGDFTIDRTCVPPTAESSSLAGPIAGAAIGVIILIVIAIFVMRSKKKDVKSGNSNEVTIAMQDLGAERKRRLSLSRKTSADAETDVRASRLCVVYFIFLMLPGASADLSVARPTPSPPPSERARSGSPVKLSTIRQLHPGHP